MTYVKGERVMWTPINARARCYGLPIAFEPLEALVLNGPYEHAGNKSTQYRIELVDEKKRKILGQRSHIVSISCLRRINGGNQQ